MDFVTSGKLVDPGISTVSAMLWGFGLTKFVGITLRGISKQQRDMTHGHLPFEAKPTGNNSSVQLQATKISEIIGTDSNHFSQ